MIICIFISCLTIFVSKSTTYCTVILFERETTWYNMQIASSIMQQGFIMDITIFIINVFTQSKSRIFNNDVQHLLVTFCLFNINMVLWIQKFSAGFLSTFDLCKWIHFLFYNLSKLWFRLIIKKLNWKFIERKSKNFTTGSKYFFCFESEHYS